MECNAHEQRGFNDGAEWLASQVGVTPSEAKKNLKTAGELDEHPETKDALLAGKLSLDQAGEIVDTDREVPGSEKQLVDVAANKDLTRLREAARDARQKAAHPGELHKRQHKAREFRMWTNSLGNICGRFELTPETGIPILRRLERETNRLNRSAKAQAKQASHFQVEPWHAYAADAFVNMLNTAGTGARSPHVDLVIVCDLRAWRRGHAHEGEPCHILDGGPIPVELAKQLAKDAFLNVVLHDGVDLITLTRMGRYIPAHLREALDIGDPPDFTGKKCADCGKRHGLQIDHVDPLANGGPTTRRNLEPRCYTDHRAKTERDRKAGLLKPGRKRNADSSEAANRSTGTLLAANRDPPRPP